MDSALPAIAQVQLLTMLRDALGLLGPGRAAQIDISAGDDACLAIIQAPAIQSPAEPPAAAAVTTDPAPEFARLRDNAREAGITMDVDSSSAGVRLDWQIPLGATLSAADG